MKVTNLSIDDQPIPASVFKSLFLRSVLFTSHTPNKMTPPPNTDATVIGSPKIKNATIIAINGSIYRNTPVFAVDSACKASYHAMYASPEQNIPRKITPSQPSNDSAGISV